MRAYRLQRLHLESSASCSERACCIGIDGSTRFSIPSQRTAYDHSVGNLQPIAQSFFAYAAADPHWCASGLAHSLYVFLRGFGTGACSRDHQYVGKSSFVCVARLVIDGKTAQRYAVLDIYVGHDRDVLCTQGCAESL